MRGEDTHQTRLFHQISYETVIPANHPLRDIRRVVDHVLEEMSPVFERMYAKAGRPSIPPERLLRALLIGILFTVRSERHLMDRLKYDLLSKWFVGLEIGDEVWDASTFTRNRDRFMGFAVSKRFFDRILAEADRRRLLSQKHFSVDGTLIQAWASAKSVRPIEEDNDEDAPPPPGGRNAEQDFRGQQRTNDTHRSTTDPEARLFKKADGQAAMPSFMGHLMTDNLNGLVVDATVTIASGTAEREEAVKMAKGLKPGSTLGGDKGYDAKATVARLREMGITPHLARNHHARRFSTIDGRTTRHRSYSISQRRRKLIEEVFGWVKTVGNFRKARWIGRARIEWRYILAMAAYNLVRMTGIERKRGIVA